MFDEIEGLTPEVKAVLEKKVKENFVAKSEFEAVLSKKEELLDEAKKAKATKSEAEEAAERARLDAAAKSGDIESLRKSYEDKLQAMNAQINTFNEEKKKSNIGSVAGEFVNAHIVDDQFIREAMKQEFAKRLDVRDGQLSVLDANGNLTALTVEDLKNEFLNNSKYSRQLVGSRANGGGAEKSSRSKDVAYKSLKDIPIADRKARLAYINAQLTK